MPRNTARPLSPHLMHWRWGPHMFASIGHRVTGSGLATVGALSLVWWLVSLASGEEAYATFLSVARSPIGWVLAIGLTWAVFMHMAGGVRHWIMDVGAGYDLPSNKRMVFYTAGAGVLLTALYWAYIVVAK